MRTERFIATGCLLLACYVGAARAAILEAVPVVRSGGVTVTVQVSGLSDLSPPSLAAFDLEFLYQPSILALRQVTFGPFLGHPDLSLYLCEFSCVLVGGPLSGFPLPPGPTQAETSAALRGFDIGNMPPSLALHLSETSLLGIALDGAQPADFALLTIDFGIQSKGTSQLGLFVNSFEDPFGNPIAIANSIDILGKTFVAVPPVTLAAPDSLTLLLICLSGLALGRRSTRIRRMETGIFGSPI